jgi:addiction module HigA family antidote
MSMVKLNFAVHPGRILHDEYLAPLDMSAGKLAAHLGVPRTRIERLVKEEVSMTPETANLLAAAFKTSPAFWLNLQTNHDVATMKPPRDVKPLELAVA